MKNTLTTKDQIHILLSTFLMVICGSGVGIAADTEQSIEQIKIEAAKLLQQGKYEEACDILETVEEDEHDPQLTFLLGQCRFGMQDYSAAVFRYNLMLERNTNLPRVRTELARSLSVMGKNKAAKEEYEKVLAQKLPSSVRQNITTQLDNINSRRRGGGVFSLGYMYDTNVNGAPSDPSIQAFGLPFLLDTDSTDQSDSALVGSISYGSYFDGFTADEWRYDIYGSFLDYSSENDFNSHSVGLSIGPNFYSNFQLYLPVGVNAFWEGGHYASQTVSFSPTIDKNLTRKLRFSAQLRIQYFDDHRTSNESNGWSNGISLDFQYSINLKNMVELGLSIQNNDANDLDYNRYLSETISLGWYTAFNNGIRLSFQPSYTKRDYSSADIVDAGETRNDNFYNTNVNIYKEISTFKIPITYVLAFTWSKNDSDIDRRDYEREQYFFQIRKQF